MNKYSYPLIIHQDEYSLWAEFPDLIGCQTFGESVDEIVNNATEALICYLEEELKYSAKLPSPSNKENIIKTDNDDVKIITITI
ncbi:MAG: type II toxin-antitoxin system HicB family antitoxin [Selenomonadaceae bacterium]|nr:type II toxin-antitoxin system HicB family antitoxin [Selenomonadaceae bacterium]MBP3722069.1 type II toxin-antitoxin system HicB family antitoxin [Selenomonadaceae bacterium]